MSGYVKFCLELNVSKVKYVWVWRIAGSLLLLRTCFRVLTALYFCQQYFLLFFVRRSEIALYVPVKEIDRKINLSVQERKRSSWKKEYFHIFVLCPFCIFVVHALFWDSCGLSVLFEILVDTEISKHILLLIFLVSDRASACSKLCVFLLKNPTELLWLKRIGLSSHWIFQIQNPCTLRFHSRHERDLTLYSIGIRIAFAKQHVHCKKQQQIIQERLHKIANTSLLN